MQSIFTSTHQSVQMYVSTILAAVGAIISMSTLNGIVNKTHRNSV